MAIEGTYLLIQNDKYQRVLSFDRGGNIAQVSDQQTHSALPKVGAR